MTDRTEINLCKPVDFVRLTEDDQKQVIDSIYRCIDRGETMVRVSVSVYENNNFQFEDVHSMTPEDWQNYQTSGGDWDYFPADFLLRILYLNWTTLSSCHADNFMKVGEGKFTVSYDNWTFVTKKGKIIRGEIIDLPEQAFITIENETPTSFALYYVNEDELCKVIAEIYLKSIKS